jgi:putative sugar O-methyltransferase
MQSSLKRIAKTAKAHFSVRLGMWKFALHCDRRFKQDARYDLQYVTRGFLPRLDGSDSDSELLDRICTAYIRSVQQEQFWPVEPSLQVRQQNLQPFKQALLARDISAVGGMLRNFYRDPCSSGLLAPPNGMSKAYFRGAIRDVYRRFYLGHVLYRFDYWMAQTNGAFTLSDLAGPGIGNPFGVLIEGTHISVGAEYAHYCAYRIGHLLDSGKATIAELKGGFGGMAYYLLRDRPSVTYLDFDTPERIALASYYLLKAFPHRKFILFGEQKLTTEALATSSGALMPLSALADMPSRCVDITFCSHSLSNIPAETTVKYIENIDRITRGRFFLIDNQQVCHSISDSIERRGATFKLTETRPSGWHSHKVSGAGVGGAAGLAESVALEHCYLRAENSHKLAMHAC